MPALSVIDLAMFLLETPERPYNIGPLAIIAVSYTHLTLPTRDLV